MKFTPSRKKYLSILVIAAALNLNACGYFLYPEREGQKSGKLDSTVVILDAIGLLLYVVPGVIAFAVDISTGTIYLPPGGKSVLEKHAEDLSQIEDLDLIPVEAPQLEELEALADYVSVHTGVPIDASDLQVFSVNKSASIALAAL